MTAALPEAAGTPGVETIATPELGNRSYIVHDGRTAVVVDPQRDIDRVQSVLERRALVCAAVLETHIHNDYLTGSLALARMWGAEYVVNRDDPVRFSRRGVVDGEELSYGDLDITVLATPGHTETHLAYLIDVGSGPSTLLSGGSLLHGGVGRSDLVDAALTEPLTRAQLRSVRRLGELPPQTLLLPTHGFGSFCSAGGGAMSTSDGTLAGELAGNPALTAADENTFVTETITGLGAYPTYYRHMAPLNLDGPATTDLGPPQRLPSAAARVLDGRVVIDVRPRRAHAAGHVPYSLGIEMGPQFATYVGWLVPWGTPLALLGQNTDQVTAARRQLARIGFDDVRSLLGVPAEEMSSTYPVADFEALGRAREQGRAAVLLDVRTPREHAQRALPGAHNIELHDLEMRMADLPEGQIWVHCASGYRASIAASILNSTGRDVTLVDDSLRQL